MQALISTQNGMGEESMNAFIHEHLSSILQPLAARLDKLDESLLGTQNQLAEVTSASAVHAKQLHEDSSTIVTMRIGMEKTQFKLDTTDARLEAKLKEIGDNRKVVAADLQKHAAEISKLHGQQSQTQASLQDLTQNFQDSRPSFQALKADFMRLQGSIAGFDSTIAKQMQSDLQDLREACQSTLDLLKQTESAQEKGQKDLEFLGEAFERQRYNDDGRANEFTASMAKLQRRMDQTNDYIKDFDSDRIQNALSDILILQKQSRELLRSQSQQ